MAFATCDRCRNAIVLGDDQANRAFCPYCKAALRVISREEFFGQLNRGESESKNRSADDSEEYRDVGGWAHPFGP